MSFLYALYDVKAETYGLPLDFDNDVQAVRITIQMVQRNPNIQPSQYREDFRLKRIGEYDSETGIVEGFPAPFPTVLDLGTIPRGDAAPSSPPVDIPGPGFIPTQQ